MAATTTAPAVAKAPPAALLQSMQGSFANLAGTSDDTPQSGTHSPALSQGFQDALAASTGSEHSASGAGSSAANQQPPPPSLEVAQPTAQGRNGHGLAAAAPRPPNVWADIVDTTKPLTQHSSGDIRLRPDGTLRPQHPFSSNRLTLMASWRFNTNAPREEIYFKQWLMAL